MPPPPTRQRPPGAGGEESPAGDRAAAHDGPAPPPDFSLLIKPAGPDCNLRCDYCFYLDRAALYPATPRHRMSDDVLEAVIRSFLATPQQNHAFGWQGGEPTLMGAAFFRRVTELQQRHGRPGTLVSNGLQTNGTLIDDDLAAHLAAYRFLVGISVDGPPDLHNRHRRTADGRDSYDSVIRGLGRLRRHGAEVNALALVSQANVRHPERVYRHLRDDLGFLHHQYIECVEFDAAGALRPFAINGAEWGEFLCRLFDLWQAGDTRRVSVRLFDTLLARLVDGATTTCSIGDDCRQYLVVEHNGDVYPCDFHVAPGRLLGNVLRDDWARLWRSPLFRAFGARKRAWPPACRECPHLDLCQGDCPKNRGPAAAAGVPARSRLCAGWRRFFAHARPGLEALAAEVRRERQAASAGLPAAPPPGRNAPCPCGSGLKFKRCCGRPGGPLAP